MAERNRNRLRARGEDVQGLAGVGSTVFVLAAPVSAWVVFLKKEWMRIAVHMAGSWVAAISLLMLGWVLR